MLVVVLIISIVMLLVTLYLLYKAVRSTEADAGTKRNIIIGNVVQMLCIFAIMWFAYKTSDAAPVAAVANTVRSINSTLSTSSP